VAAAPAPGESGNGKPRGDAVDVEELADVRLLLEPAAADWAARRADRASLAVLQRIAAQFEAAAHEPEPRFDLLGATDMELHLELARVADNSLLVRLIEQLHGLYRTRIEWSLRRPGRLQETTAEHRRLVEAVVAGSPEEARAAMEAHLEAAAASFRLTAPAGEGELGD
jgi:GntR family transcriptional repressor for pyruvate dehydrogenase complex